MTTKEYNSFTNKAEVKNITDKDFDEATLKYQGLTILECVSDNNGLFKTMESVLFKLKESIDIPSKHLRIDSQKTHLLSISFKS